MVTYCQEDFGLVLGIFGLVLGIEDASGVAVGVARAAP
jgi:hypothetical protein